MRQLYGLMLITILLGAALSLCLFTVKETDRALVLRLGKILTDGDDKPVVLTPGLHFKVPFIDSIRMFDVRINILDIKASRITTSEKKDVDVDYYVQWRIDNVPLYYKRTGGRRPKAEQLLESRSNSGLKIEFGRLTINEVVSVERVELMERLRKMIDDNAESTGISVIDVRMKKINLPKEVNNSVYNRMRAERARKANSFRADGEKQAISKRAEADKKRRILLAEADKKSKQVRGEGDATAVEIYAKTYNQSPEFFEFYRTLEAYKHSFKDQQDILLLKPEGDFFRYFRQFESGKR